MATKTKHRERSKRRYAQKEAGKNWFFNATEYNRVPYVKSSSANAQL